MLFVGPLATFGRTWLLVFLAAPVMTIGAAELIGAPVPIVMMSNAILVIWRAKSKCGHCSTFENDTLLTLTFTFLADHFTLLWPPQQDSNLQPPAS